MTVANGGGPEGEVMGLGGVAGREVDAKPVGDTGGLAPAAEAAAKTCAAADGAEAGAANAATVALAAAAAAVAFLLAAPPLLGFCAQATKPSTLAAVMALAHELAEKLVNKLPLRLWKILVQVRMASGAPGAVGAGPRLSDIAPFAAA